MRSHRHWVGTISSAVLFALVFASQESALIAMSGSHRGVTLGLLLFMLPGFVGGIVSYAHKILAPLLGAILVLPLCLVVFNFYQPLTSSLWYQFTYLLSALFWCACGALACHIILAMVKRPAHKV